MATLTYRKVKARADWMPDGFYVVGWTEDGKKLWLTDVMLKVLNSTSPLDAPIVYREGTYWDTSAHRTGAVQLSATMINGDLYWRFTDETGFDLEIEESDDE